MLAPIYALSLALRPRWAECVVQGPGLGLVDWARPDALGAVYFLVVGGMAAPVVAAALAVCSWARKLTGV